MSCITGQMVHAAKGPAAAFTGIYDILTIEGRPPSKSRAAEFSPFGRRHKKAASTRARLRSFQTGR